MKTTAGKPVSKMSLPEFQRFRVQNLYSAPRAPGWTHLIFWTAQQLSIVVDVYIQFKNKVTSMWAIDLEYMRSDEHKAYFKDALPFVRSLTSSSSWTLSVTWILKLFSNGMPLFTLGLMTTT